LFAKAEKFMTDFGDTIEEYAKNIGFLVKGAKFSTLKKGQVFRSYL
jgi:hypothetical protein